MEYEDQASLTEAETLRRKLAAAVQVAQRARTNELETMLAAREADRALGRMILAAREAGDLATEGQWDDQGAVLTLDSLKINRNLAADAVALAQVPDDLWRKQLDDTDVLSGATYRAVTRWAREYLDAHERAERTRKEQIAAEKKLAEDAEKRLAELRAAPVDPVIPPLRPDETSLEGADVALGAMLPEDQGPSVDERPEIIQQEKLIKSAAQLVDKIESCDPTIRNDAARDADVLAARSAIRRLVDSATIWLRTLNALYADLGKDVEHD
jgi:hypothetical protein